MRKRASQMLLMARQMRPCELDDDVLYLWLSTLEYRVLYEVMGEEATEIVETDLLVAPPHDDIYWTYLVSMIDFSKGDMQSYAQSSALAEKAWKRFVQCYHQKKYSCTKQ